MPMQPREEIEVIGGVIGRYLVEVFALGTASLSSGALTIFLLLSARSAFSSYIFKFGDVVFGDLLVNIVALPGLLLFLFVGLWMRRGRRMPKQSIYLATGLTIAAVNRVALVAILSHPSYNFMDEELFVLPIFACTGGITAAIHLKMLKFAQAFKVTCRSESARYVDI